jgi:hypothetical protein
MARGVGHRSEDNSTGHRVIDHRPPSTPLRELPLFYSTASSHPVRFLLSSHPTQTTEENRYGLRNRRRNDREVEEGSDDEDQEPENGGNDYDNNEEEEEEGRPPQRQRVNEEHVENQDNDWENESLEQPVVLNRQRR